MPRSIICINNFRHLPSIIVHLTNRFAKLGLRNSTHLIKNQCGFIWNTNFFVLLSNCHGDTARDMCNVCSVHHKRPLFKLSKIQFKCDLYQFDTSCNIQTKVLLSCKTTTNWSSKHSGDRCQCIWFDQVSHAWCVLVFDRFSLSFIKFQLNFENKISCSYRNHICVFAFRPTTKQ